MSRMLFYFPTFYVCNSLVDMIGEEKKASCHIMVLLVSNGNGLFKEELASVVL